jgi:cytochrome b
MPLNNLHTINVWDVLIRIFHWSHVGFFTLAYLTEGEDEWMTIHSYAGYSILILLVFRLLWGCIKRPAKQSTPWHRPLPSIA